MADTPIIIRKHTVRAMTGLSDSSIDRHEQTGDFPKRVKLSKRAVGWYEAEVVAWIQHRREVA
jgi:prophage regulatory protein